MAAHEMTWCRLAQGRGFLPAALLGEAATRMEIAAAGWVRGARHLALECNLPHANTRIGHRYGAHQGGSIGMTRPREKGLARRQLDELTDVHHGYSVRDVPHHGEIVRNE